MPGERGAEQLRHLKAWLKGRRAIVLIKYDARDAAASLLARPRGLQAHADQHQCTNDNKNPTEHALIVGACPGSHLGVDHIAHSHLAVAVVPEVLLQGRQEVLKARLVARRCAGCRA